MTETQAPSPATAEPSAPAAAPKPKPKLQRANLPNLIATQMAYTAPALEHLEQVFQKHLQQHPGSNPVAEVVHYDHVCDWCRQNPEQAARIVMASIYMANGSFMVQVPPPEAEPEPDAPAPESSASAPSQEPAQVG